MIRSLRRRFILSGMAAFSILLLILVIGVTAVGFIQVENEADAFMRAVMDEHAPRPGNRRMRETPGRLARPFENPMGYYIVTFGASGEIEDVQEKGIWEPDLEVAREMALRVQAIDRETGKVDSYKFLLQREDGGARLILMDNSMQLQLLGDIIRITLCLIGACLALLFLILLPISNRVVRSYALHIEKQKQFITNAGHEIKTPVAIIMSNVDAMDLIQGENKWSRNIRGQTERLNILLQRLLFMARIDEKSLVLPMEVLNLNALLGAELETYGEIIAERGLKLNCDLSMDVRIHGNRDYLQQLVHMLLDNAVQYADAGGEIGITLEKRRRKVRLVFSNSVSALPDCPPEALFDRFYRGDRARTQSGGGYGIGLSAVRAIAEIHRGAAAAEYDGEHRIRFIVEIPAKA